MTAVSSTPRAYPVRGAALMIGAGLAYAGVNVATEVVAYRMGFPSTSLIFWQYLIGFVFTLPLVIGAGARALRTRHPVLHVVRVVLSAAGAQAFGLAFAHGVPLWQVIALVMTSPFFIIIGAGLILREEVTAFRLGATLTGFLGAMIILQPWSSSFTLAALLPIAAALLWAAASLITKYLTRDETPESITLYLLLLLTPVNALFLLPNGLAVPSGDTLWLVLVIGFLSAGAQYLLTRAYAVADATYLQPFDDLKLPLNLIAGWVILAQTPSPSFWPGALLIVLASLAIMRAEAGKRRAFA